MFVGDANFGLALFSLCYQIFPRSHQPDSELFLCKFCLCLNKNEMEFFVLFMLAEILFIGFVEQNLREAQNNIHLLSLPLIQQPLVAALCGILHGFVKDFIF